MMKRAYSIEMGVLRGYATYLFGIGFFVAAIVGVGTQTPIVAPAVLTCMYLMMGAIGAAAYDDQNGWGRYRLALPVSRRDVVLARYAAVVTLGLIGALVGLVASLAVMGIASAVDLPGGLSDDLSFSVGNVCGMSAATAACMLIGSGVAAVVIPVYFKFGQTRATQLLPTIVVIVFVVPVMVLGNSGVLDGAARLGIVTDFLAFIDEPAGLVVAITAVVILSFALLALSAAVSLRLYSKREL